MNDDDNQNYHLKKIKELMLLNLQQSEETKRLLGELKDGMNEMMVRISALEMWVEAQEDLPP